MGRGVFRWVLLADRATWCVTTRCSTAEIVRSSGVARTRTRCPSGSDGTESSG
jgi:hypothetical protein